MLLKKKKHKAALFSVPNMLLMFFAAALVIIVDEHFWLPSDLQGESGMVATALLIIIVKIINHRYSAAVIGVLAGFIAAVFVPGQRGALHTIIIFSALGIGMEIGLFIMGGTIRHLTSAILAATMGNLLQFTAKWLYDSIVGAPVGMINEVVPITALQYTLFGLAGGIIGFFFLYVFDRIQDAKEDYSSNQT